MGLDRGIAQASSDHKNKVAGPHFLFSAENPKFPEKNELNMTHEQTLNHLKGAGYDAHEVQGHYGAPERSIAVYGVNPQQAEGLHSLASRLGQDSSIYSTGKDHEMRFHHGENAGKKITGTGTVWHQQKPADFFTALPGGLGHFTHNFDWSKSDDSMKKSRYYDGGTPLHKSESSLIPKPSDATYKELSLHHGTKSKENFDNFDLKHHQSGFYPGVYTTTDPARAKEFGRSLNVKFKGHVFEIKDPKHAEQLHAYVGGGGSGTKLANKLKEAGYHAIKRGNEHIILDPSNAKIEKSEDNELNKGFKELGTALGMAGALATATPSTANAPIRTPSHQQAPAYDHHKMLRTIAAVESSGGKDTHHAQLLSGERAYGKYGLTPNIIHETINLNPDLKHKNQKALLLHGDSLMHYMKDNPHLEDQIADKHLARLEHHFGQNPEDLGYAWLEGIKGTYRAKKKHADISGHWHVAKIRNAYAQGK